MEASDNKSLQAEIEETLVAARQFQQEHPDNQMVNAVLEHLISRLKAAQKQRQFEAVMDYHRNIKEVLEGKDKRERVSGQVQIVTAANWEEAKEQCPWACRFQPAGKLSHQQGKWICFESHDDADDYRNLQDL